MKFRCPYCKAEFPQQDAGACPECGKVMRVPGPYRKRQEPRSRKKKHRVRRPDSAPPLLAAAVFARNPRIVVIALVAMVAVGAALVFKSEQPVMSDDDKSKATRYNLINLSRAITNFHRHCGRYPTTEEGLWSLWYGQDIPGWAGPYVADPPAWPWTDYWKTPYEYRCVSGTVALASAGPDRTLGTGDDLVSPYFRPSPTSRIYEALAEWNEKRFGTNSAVATE